MLEFFARNFFDQVWIAFQRSDLLSQLDILRIQAIDFLPHALDFILRLLHGNKSVGAKDIVNHQRQDEQTEQRAAVLSDKCRKGFPHLHALQFFSTHSVASLVKRADAFGLSAST